MKEPVLNYRKPVYFNSKIYTYFQWVGLSLLFFLLTIDFIFMGLHSLKSLGYLSDPNLSITKNFGYGESFQYIKAAFLMISFLWLASKWKKPLFFCWAAVFAYILVDDSLEIHEYLGYKLGVVLDEYFPALNGGGTLGELIVFGLFGLALFIPLFYFYFKSKDPERKIMSQDLFMLFIAMLFFGIGVDFIHDLAETGTILNGMLGLLEDGGEMIVLSAMVWYVWALLKHDRFFERTGSENLISKRGKSIPTAAAARVSRDRRSMAHDKKTGKIRELSGRRKNNP